MPVGNGVVLIGMSERTSRQGISQFAAALFAKGAAERVIVAAMPKLRAAMHLDTVFTFADRDLVTLYPPIMDQVHPISLRPGDSPAASTRPWRRKPFVDVVAEALNLKKLRVIETGGDHYAAERGQWDSGNNLVCASPGRRGRIRPQHLDQHRAAQGRDRGDHDRRRRAGPRPRRRPLHDLPADSGRRRLLIPRGLRNHARAVLRADPRRFTPAPSPLGGRGVRR